MSTNVVNIPSGVVLVQVQMESGGTGFVPVQMQAGGSGLVPFQLQAGGSGSVPVQMQSGGTGSVLGSSPDTKLLEFKRTFPQALGTVQIMVGALLFLFGVVECFFGDTFTKFSGVFVWAPLLYIIAGSLTVVADRSMSRCMIKGSMGMNIVAATMSFAAIILYGMDTGGLAMDYIDGYWDLPLIYRYFSMGVSGVQCVFNLLMFIISICVSVFGCKATCSSSCCQQTPILQPVVIGNHLPEVSTVMSLATPSASAPPSYTEVNHTLSEGGSSQGCGK